MTKSVGTDGPAAGPAQRHTASPFLIPTLRSKTVGHNENLLHTLIFTDVKSINEGKSVEDLEAMH